MPQFTISGRRFDLDAETVRHRMVDVLPDPLQEHYVVVEGRRFPPKQVVARATDLDRADFTTHQARRILLRLGFVAARVGHDNGQSPPAPRVGPHGGRQAEMLAPYVGQWVALGGPTELLVAANTPQEVISWLNRHGRQARYGMFRVPASAREAEGAAPHQVRFEFLELPGVEPVLTRPVIPVQVEDLENAPQLCLVDSGSTTNRFGLWLADEVGLDLAGAPQTELAIGGALMTAYHGRCDLTIAGVRYDAPVSFCDPWPFGFNLLGQEGFLRFFRVTFCAAEGWLDLEHEASAT